MQGYKIAANYCDAMKETNRMQRENNEDKATLRWLVRSF